MNSASPHVLKDEDLNAPIACIDAQDVAYVLPLREYLETRGCRVIINEQPPMSPYYHLVVGDGLFVKQILGTTQYPKAKQLGIVWGDPRDASAIEGFFGVRVILVDAASLTPQKAEQVFAFFFAGSGVTLDLREKKEVSATGMHLAPEPARFTPKPPPEAETLLNRDDHTRIGALIADVFEKEHAEQKKRGRRKLAKPLWAMLIGVVALFVVPTLWYFTTTGIAVATLFQAGKLAERGEVATARRLTDIGVTWARQGDGVLSLMAPPLSLVGLGSVARGQERLHSLLADIAVSAYDAYTMVDTGKNVAQSLLASADTQVIVDSPAVAVAKMHVLLVGMENSLGLAQAELTNILADKIFPFQISFIGAQGKRGLEALAALRSRIHDMDSMLTMYPLLSGFKEPKTYLLLLQNSMELRPTGGFIGTIGTVEFADGRMGEIEIRDVYDADGQLKGHVAPPPPIRDIIGQEHWYLRDSNWDPDFRESGERAAWFYEKEMGKSVDGVIAINTQFVVDLLAAVGPVELPDYNDRITAENFYGKALYYTQANYFPGSTQKRDFIGTLTRTLLTQMVQEDNGTPAGIFTALSRGLGSHSILLWFRDKKLQTLAEHFGWGGAVPLRDVCAPGVTTTCFFDPLIMVEANLGVNKANAFITRKTNRDINLLEDGTVLETVRTTYHNSSNGQPGGGVYRAYVQMLMPPETAISSIAYDNVNIPTHEADSKAKAPLPYVERTTTLAGLPALGIAFEVPGGGEHTLAVTYLRTAPVVPSGGEVAFEFFQQKQPGVVEQVTRTMIHYPVYWLVSSDNQPGILPPSQTSFLAKEAKFEYNSQMTEDSTIRIRVTK